MIIISIVIFILNTQFAFRQVLGSSMSPNYHNRDIVLMKKTASLRRYDVVAFKEGEKDYIKRLIGLPKDYFILQGNQLTLSLGASDFRSVLTIEIQPKLVAELKGKTQLPEGNYLMLGDASAISKDSRDFGLISKKQIEGKIIWKS